MQLREEPAAKPECVRQLEERIGYTFRDRELALRALSHRSLNSERRQGRDAMAEHNEQLEFLGDSVLGLLVGEFLFRKYPELPEGQLSIHKARIVSAAHLVAVMFMAVQLNMRGRRRVFWSDWAGVDAPRLSGYNKTLTHGTHVLPGLEQRECFGATGLHQISR